jgi:hypothetical protein
MSTKLFYVHKYLITIHYNEVSNVVTVALRLNKEQLDITAEQVKRLADCLVAERFIEGDYTIRTYKNKGKLLYDVAQ